MTEKEITICGHGSGCPTTKNMYTYLNNRYKLTASNGKHKGVVAVRRVKGMTDEERKLFHDAYAEIIGRNIYSQSLRTYVFKPYNGKYYSDCSSSGDACFKKAGHDVGWLNTAGQYTSSLFESVPVVIKDGHIQNPDVLKVGDALLFVGEDSSRPLQIGHVEYIYEIPQAESWHWVRSGTDWYYQNQNGQNTYGWKLIKETGGSTSHWYFFDGTGRMLTGIITDGGKLYYLQTTGPLEGACCKTDESGALAVWDVS